MRRGWSGDDRPDHQGAGRGRRGVPGADRAVPSGAAGALLPDARILPGRRGRPPGHAAGRLAGPRRVRGTRLAPHLALPDRHQPVPQRASLGQPTPGQGVGHARGRTARADPARRGRVARAVSRRPARGCDRRAARPGGPLRADRSHLPGLRDRAAGPAASPARRAHPARRPRIPRERGGRHARLDRRIGQQRPQTGPRQPAAPAAADRRARTGSRPRLTRRARRSWRSSSAPTSPPISTRWSPCSPTTSSSRCHRCPSNTRAATSWPASSPASSARAGRFDLVPTRANGQPAFGAYLRAPTGVRHGTGLFVLTLTGDRICAMTRFDNSVLPWFGLPRSLPS